ncbi:hypothetical protein XENORESO_002211 [Xenotaenia resolanae]|uniref:Uncharacterized protein n=1 Tax=Xenotaenia resolanae TaxID=208358 RepID=A0ABV0W0M8_9TELE
MEEVLFSQMGYFHLPQQLPIEVTAKRVKYQVENWGCLGISWKIILLPVLSGYILKDRRKIRMDSPSWENSLCLTGWMCPTTFHRSCPSVISFFFFKHNVLTTALCCQNVCGET